MEDEEAAAADKSEYLNPKQILMTEKLMTETALP
jgi:hypothetical protein